MTETTGARPHQGAIIPPVAKSQRAIALIVLAVAAVPILLAVTVFAALRIYLHTDAAADLDPAVAVNIRIHNGMDVDIDRLWLGRGITPGASNNPTFRTRYTDIGVSEDSPYQPVEHYQPNYEGLNVVNGDDNFIVFSDTLGPLVAELQPGGYYTFVLDQQGDQVLVTEVTTDPAPS